jgi:hypothetical protein
MWWHTEGVDFILLADLLEFERVIALMAVDNQQLPRAYSTILCMRNKVL